LLSRSISLLSSSRTVWDSASLIAATPPPQAFVSYERIDTSGHVIGFAVFNFLKRDRKPVELPIEFTPVAARH
jgi:hypothetical protein